VWRGLSAVALLWLSLSAQGHRLAQSVTELEWRVDEQRLEVTHSIHLDDAIPLLINTGGVDGELGPLAQARLLYYVEQHFELTLRDAQPVELTPVGAAIDGEYLWIYQELSLPRFPENLRLNVSLLQDFHLDQQNLVNLKVGDHVQSLRFDRDHQTGAF
jgi:hypothetical protein